MTNLIFFGNYNAMKCKFNSIQVPELPKVHFILFEFFEGNPSRTEWREASKCGLGTLLEKLDIATSPSPDYNHLGPVNHPDLVMSLSHSKNVGIICVAKAADIQSIGIDLEFEGRKINPKSARFFMQPDEDHSNLLEAWVKKEAAFKAVSPLYPDCKLLKQIRFQNNRFYFSSSLPRNDQHVTGEVVTLSKEVSSHHLTITIAYLKPLKPNSHP